MLKKLPPKTILAEVVVGESACTLMSSGGEQTWTKITETEIIEKWLLRRNKKHLQQVYDDESPHVSAEMERILGEHGIETPVDQLLDGTLDKIIAEEDECMSEWRRYMVMTPRERKLEPVSAEISPDTFAAVFKEANERTSSSPEGLHYTLWKAIAEKEEFCKYMSVMMYLPFKYGFSVKRWQRAIDVMLEKQEGIRKIHLMRIIGLVEADTNCALKILYSDRLMKNAEQAGISCDQWGGRKNRDATACATRRRLTWDYANIRKSTVCMGAADAASCFDRVTRPHASVLCQKK